MKKSKYHSFQKLLLSLWHDNKLYKTRFILSILLIFITAAISLALPWWLKQIVERLGAPNTQVNLYFLLFSYGAIWLCAQIFVSLRQIAVYPVFARGVHKLGIEVFEKLLNLPLSYHVDRSTGGILNALERAQNAFPDVLFGLIFVVIPMIVEVLIATCFIGYYYTFKYVLVIFGLFSVYFAFTWISISWITDAQRKDNKEDREVNSYIADILMNIEYIHYQNYRQPALRECRKRMVRREISTSQKLVRIDLIYLGQIVIAGLGFLILTVLVGRDVDKGSLVVSDFVLLNGYLIQLLMPLNAIGASVLRKIREGLTRMEDVMDIILMPDSQKYINANKLMPNTPVSIEFKNVFFKYPGCDNYVLENTNLCLMPGKVIALTGGNGSGKSTLVKLLYRLYDPINGEILLNQQNIKNYDLESLRSHIGIVPQETLLLNDTLYANLVMDSNISIDSEHFRKVMHEARIDDWVNELPEGYNTAIGERGVKLSGGERQRISLARMLLRRPKIIIMDEATSAIDEKTEHEIFMQLKHNFTNISKLIITHNSKNLSFADEIINLDGRSVLTEAIV